MITRLTLTNFMAHAATVLDFPSGLSVLTGPNNTGKSAIVEALRCLTQNPAPRHVIRHGAAEARVSVTLSDGTEVAWVRRPRYALYELTRPGAAEPEVFAKFGRTPPAEILDVLRLDLVPLEIGEPVDVHIGNQREPVFLLNQPGTAVAGFFAASSEAAHLIAMQNRLTDRARKAKAESRRLEGQLAAIAASLDKLASLPDLEYRLGAADVLETRLAAFDREIPALERSMADRENMLLRQGRLSRIDRTLCRMAAPPELVATAPLAASLDRLRAVAAEAACVAGRGAVLSLLSQPPQLADTASLAVHLGTLGRLKRTAQRQVAKAAVLDRALSPPTLADTTGLSAMLGRLTATRQGLAGLGAATARLSTLTPPPEIEQTRHLAEVLAAIAAARDALAAHKAALAARTRDLAACEERIAVRLDAMGVCPLCGGALSSADFLGAGHVHPDKDATP